MYHKLETGSIIATTLKLRYKQEEDVEYFKASFPRAKWVFFENDFYNEDVEQFNNGNTEFYKSLTSIPKYLIFKNKKKIGFALPRISEFADRKFLFIPRTYKSKWRADTNNKKYAILREYYIYDVDDEYIIQDDARLLFYQ